LRLFVTGWTGLLGASLVPALRGQGHLVEGCDVTDAEIDDADYLRRRLEALRPEAVFHLAAWTEVDRAESEPESAERVNVGGTRAVAAEAERVGAAVWLLSTDYVFDGSQRSPYREEDAPAPLGVYARTKRGAEASVAERSRDWAIVRSAWLFGPGGRNFVDTILDRLERGETVRVVDDQRGSPTYAPDLARGIASLVAAQARGIVHLVNAGDATWFDLAREAAHRAGFSTDRVQPSTTEAVGRPAPRPPYSVLDAGLARRRYGVSLRSWREALADHVAGRRRRRPDPPDHRGEPDEA
jgi:dTDP-4-dehydrorhamnose reductase